MKENCLAFETLNTSPPALQHPPAHLQFTPAGLAAHPLFESTSSERSPAPPLSTISSLSTRTRTGTHTQQQWHRSLDCCPLPLLESPEALVSRGEGEGERKVPPQTPVLSGRPSSVSDWRSTPQRVGTLQTSARTPCIAQTLPVRPEQGALGRSTLSSDSSCVPRVRDCASHAA